MNRSRCFFGLCLMVAMPVASQAEARLGMLPEPPVMEGVAPAPAVLLAYTPPQETRALAAAPIFIAPAPKPAASQRSWRSELISPLVERRDPGPEDKLQYYMRQTMSTQALLSSALKGVFSQAFDFSGDWGGGADAFARRSMSHTGQNMIKNSVRFGLDSALGIDSRYRPSPSDRFLPRLGHALLSTVVASKDSGGYTIGVSNLAGAYGAAFAANLWYPQSRNGAQDALMRGTCSLGWTAGKNVLVEFWPDLKRKFKK